MGGLAGPMVGKAAREVPAVFEAGRGPVPPLRAPGRGPGGGAGGPGCFLGRGPPPAGGFGGGGGEGEAGDCIRVRPPLRGGVWGAWGGAPARRRSMGTACFCR